MNNIPIVPFVLTFAFAVYAVVAIVVLLMKIDREGTDD